MPVTLYRCKLIYLTTYLWLLLQNLLGKTVGNTEQFEQEQ